MTKQEAIDLLSLYLIDDLGEAKLDTWYHGIDEHMREALGMAIEALSADAVEVVRCKNCKHRQTDECPMFFEEQIDIDEGDGYYDTDYIFHDYTRDDGFCSWGERREP